MATYLSLLSRKPGASELVLIDGSPSSTGFTIDQNGVDLGAASFDKVFSGPRGTQGARLVGESAKNRLSTWTLQVRGDDEDALQAKLSELWAMDDELRRYGGTAYWRAPGSSFLMEIEVLDSAVELVDPDSVLWPIHHLLKVKLGLTTPPYMRGPALDFSDDFAEDTEADYTLDAGASGDIAVSGGVLTVSANVATEKRLVHTARGYLYNDHQVTLKATPGSTITSHLAGVVLKREDEDNYLAVYVDDDGTHSRLRIDEVVAGVATNVASTNLAARVSNGTPFWVRGRIEGITVYAEHFTAAPTPMGAPTTSTSWQMAEVGDPGAAGIVWTPQHASATLDDFDVQAFVYRNATLPQVLPLEGPDYGDAPALVDLEVTPSGGTDAPVWALTGWWRRPDTHNRVQVGDFESTFMGVWRWVVSSVVGINGGAATSIARSTSAAKYGSASAQIVTPASTDRGASLRMFEKFKKGVTYTAEAWVQSDAGTTPVYILLGTTGDHLTSSTTALSAGWQRITVTWTPSADYDDAYVAVLTAAATATTFRMDGVMVYEGTDAPTSVSQTEGRAGFPLFGIIEGENGEVSPSSSANYRGGFAGALSAGGLPYIVDPSLSLPDDYVDDEVAVDVWARLQVSDPTSAVVLSAIPVTGGTVDTLPRVYTEEYGTAGKTPVTPGATVRRMVHLGTLRLSTTARYVLVVSGSVPLDYLMLVPAASCALSPSGKANDDTYPAFTLQTGELTRIIHSDLSGGYRDAGTPEVVAPGLGGPSLLEVRPDPTDALVKLSSLVPDDPTSDSTTEQLAHSATVHFAKVPRWQLGRS